MSQERMIPIYKRVVIKIGGEALAGPEGFGISPVQAEEIASKVKAIKDLGVEVTVVNGAGNLWRGKMGMEHGMDRATADYMGMIATVMNALALSDAFTRLGVETRVQTAVQMNSVAEPYIRLRAIRHLEKGRLVIIAGGTGNPYFTTDTAAALRAMEIGADLLIKATKVDGVYTADPKIDESATRYDALSFMEAINAQVQVLDSTAITLCMDNHLPIMVLDMWQPDSVLRAICGEDIGTLIS